jgi:hypothetical protein
MVMNVLRRRGDAFSFSYLRSTTECAADNLSARGCPKLWSFRASIVAEYLGEDMDSVASDIPLLATTPFTVADRYRQATTSNKWAAQSKVACDS